jgi:hypothetical protein
MASKLLIFVRAFSPNRALNQAYAGEIVDESLPLEGNENDRHQRMRLASAGLKEQP